MSKLDHRTFSLGARPEIVIADRNGISVVSGGVSYRIALRANETSTKIVHETEKGDVTLAEGGAVEMARLYEQLSASLASSNVDGAFSRKGVIAAAFILGAVIGLALNNGGPGKGAAPDTGPEVASAMPGGQGTGPDANQIFQELLKRRALAGPGGLPPNGQMPPLPGIDQKPEGERAAPIGAPPSLAGFSKGTAILPAPDFLKVPDTLPPLPEITSQGTSGPVQSKDDKAPSGPNPHPESAPAKEPEKAATPSASPGTPVPLAAAVAAKVAEDRIAKAMADLDTSVKGAITAQEAPSASVTSESEARKDARPAAAPESAAAAPKETKPSETTPPIKESKASETQPASNAERMPEKQIDHAAIKGVIDGMVRAGMTPDDRMKLLTQIEQLSGSGEITPQMLRELPHEVAKILVDSGVVDEADLDAPDGIPYRIIRLPEKVMEKYRGKDGIANIPERDSWVSTGNSVKLPLPGGGDIKSADDIKAFGLKP